MSRVADMREHGNSYSVKFLEFTRIYSKDRTILICLFEGQDEKYFSIRLDVNIGQNKWQGINSGGKKTVIALYESIVLHPEYNQAHFACFIDHDFEDWFVEKDSERIYVTPCYSIENLYSTETAFRRIISAEFGISEFNEEQSEFEKCLSVFASRLDEFVRAVYSFNCWVKAHRIMERDGSVKKNLNVRNVKTNSLVEIQINSIAKTYNSSNPNSVFKDYGELKLCERALQEASDSFKEKEHHLVFRGKQQIDFMRLFLIKLKEDRTSNSPVFFSSKGKVTLGLSKDNCISELSQYADTPRCLINFLDSIVLRYNAGITLGHPQVKSSGKRLQESH